MGEAGWPDCSPFSVVTILNPLCRGMCYLPLHVQGFGHLLSVQLKQKEMGEVDFIIPEGDQV